MVKRKKSSEADFTKEEGAILHGRIMDKNSELTQELHKTHATINLLFGLLGTGEGREVT